MQGWDLEADRELWKVEGLRRPSAWALSPDGASLALGTLDGEISLWDVPGRKRRSRVQGEVGVTALVWSPNGKTIAWGDALGCVVFAEGETGHEPLHFEARGQRITVLAFLPDGKA